MSSTTPTPGRLAGQLRYLFEERPELRAASDERLRDQLSLEDRYARARARYPLAAADEIHDRLGEFPDRISVELIREARPLADDEPLEPEPPGGGALGAAGDDTPGWLFAAPAALFGAGVVGFFANLAINGPDRATWTGGTLLVMMALAIGSAIWSHRHATTWYQT